MTFGELKALSAVIFKYIFFIMRTLFQRSINKRNNTPDKERTRRTGKGSEERKIGGGGGDGDLRLSPDEIRSLNIAIMACLLMLSMMVCFRSAYWALMMWALY